MAEPEINHEEDVRARPGDGPQNELAIEDLEEAAGGKIPCIPDTLPISSDPFVPLGPEL